MHMPYFPSSLRSSFTWKTPQPAVDMWSKIGAAYSRPMQKAAQEWWTSSAMIIQDHAARAWLESSQACMNALAKNAAAIQQRTMMQLMGANQAAAIIATEEMTEAALAPLSQS